MTFRDFDKHRLRELGWNEADLSNALGYGSTGYLYNVLAGERPPPLKRLTDWIKALKLEGDDATTLQLIAEDEHTPPLTKVRIERLERKIEALEAKDLERDKLIAQGQKIIAELQERIANRDRSVRG